MAEFNRWQFADWCREQNGVVWAELIPISRTGKALAVTSSRIGGVSRSPYHSLNLGLNTGDDESNVRLNREIFAGVSGIHTDPVHLPIQVHGGLCLRVNRGVTCSPRECDALATDVPRTVLGVLTADCVPIALFDPVATCVAIVHAGWRGTLARIAGNAVSLMIDEFSSDPREITAVICPAVNICCYEVSAEVASKFQDRFGRVTVEGSRVNLPLSNAIALVESGVMPENIWINTDCTSCRDDLFYSYRRDGVTGRMMTWVKLQE